MSQHALDQALAEAAWSGDLLTLNRLILRGAAIDHRDDLGRTPLMAAATAGHVDLVRALVKRGADLNLADHAEGESAIGWAACMGNHEIVVMLINAGASVDPPSSDFQHSPLMHAVINGHRATASALIAAGADVHLESASGCTAFKLATRNADVPLLEMLRERSIQQPRHKERE